MPQQCPKCAKENPDGFKFCGFCGAELVSIKEPQTERREVTVLFADMKGFTAMSEKMDPEDVQDIMNECFKGLGRCVKVEDGQVNKYSGDCIMAQFGAPIAHEDDPARACRTALAMQEFLTNYAKKILMQHGVEIKLRIGIHCGLVAAGGVGDENVHQTYDILGDTVNLAQRLEASAEPGSVLVSEQIARRTEGQFTFGDAESLTVKGKSEPVTACPLLDNITDVDPRGRDGLSVEMIGRDTELNELIKLWNQSSQESYRISIRGDMGLGKTRLVEEALPKQSSFEPVRVSATTITQRQPFGLAKRLLKAAVAFITQNKDNTPSYDEFIQLLTQVDEDLRVYAEALWYLAAPESLNVQPPDPDSETLKSLVENGLLRFAEALAARWPNLCVVLDSYELADQESKRLVEGISAPQSERLIQFITTVRPDDNTAESTMSVIDLQSLSDEHSSHLLDRLLRGAVLPKAIREMILARANGIPLYLEEMVRGLRETNHLQEAGGTWQYTGKEDADSLDLPPSLRAAMIARIDRLPREAREFLRIASVQGMEVDLDIAGRLLSAHGATSTAVAETADALLRDGLIRRCEEEGHVVFLSRMLHDACYDTLTKKDRSLLHKETAEMLCERAGGENLVEAVELAHHYDEAQCSAEAARAYLRAGYRAADLFLNDDAEMSFDRVLELTDKNDSVRMNALERLARTLITIGAYDKAVAHATALLENTSDARQRSEAQRLIAQVLLHTGKTDEAEQILGESLAAATTLKDNPNLSVRILLDLAELYTRTNRADDALTRVQEARSNCCQNSDCINRIRCDMLEGKILHTKGSFKAARDKYESAHKAANTSGTFSEQARSTNSLGNVARDIGEYDDAIAYFNKALELWNRTGDVEGQAGIYNNLGNIAMSRGEFSQAKKQQEKALELFRRIGNVQGSAMALANLACLALEEKKADDAESLASDSLDTIGDAGQWMRDLIQLIVGDARIASGKLDEAKATFREIKDHCSETENPLAYAGALRGLGRIAVKEGEPETGLNLLKQAVILYGKLERAQEMARTQMHKAEALLKLDQKEDGLKCLRKAEKTLTELQAHSDAAKARQAIEDINPVL